MRPGSVLPWSRAKNEPEMATDNVTVSKTGNKEGITAPTPWSFKVRLGAVMQETEAGPMYIMGVFLVLESGPLEWVPVSLTPACSADANQCSMWWFSGNLLVMPCVIL